LFNEQAKKSLFLLTPKRYYMEKCLALTIMVL
jgi:hypothetical protein